eukprot:44590-Rhodomonas_salina.1
MGLKTQWSAYWAMSALCLSLSCGLTPLFHNRYPKARWHTENNGYHLDYHVLLFLGTSFMALACA